MTEGKKTAFDKSMEMGAEADSDQENQGPYIPRAVFTRDATLDLSKLQISTLRLAQGMTQEVVDRKAGIGDYVLTNFPSAQEVTLVPLGATNIRSYKPEPTKPAKCSAPTGDFGFGDPGGVCEECPLSKWGERDETTGKSKPPPCNNGVVMRAYSITHKCLVDFQFMGGEASKGSFIQQQAMSFGWAGFAIKMGASQKSNNRGSWYIPEIEMLGEVPEEHKGIADKWFAIFDSSQIDSRDEAIKALSAAVDTTF